MATNNTFDDNNNDEAYEYPRKQVEPRGTNWTTVLVVAILVFGMIQCSKEDVKATIARQNTKQIEIIYGADNQ